MLFSNSRVARKLNGQFLEEASSVMKVEQKSRIIKLRSRGVSYGEIAQEMGMPVNTVKSVCRRNGMCNGEGHRCLYCNGKIKQLLGTKKRMFCSDKCRQRYWNKLRSDRVSKNRVSHLCPVCGKTFYDYSSSKRTYCSQECYHKRNSHCTESSD